jgi:predicted nucleic acid-binding protein
VIVVDSSVLVDLLAQRDVPHVARLKGLIERERLLLGDIVLCEVLRGARSEGEAVRMRERLAEFMPVEMVGEQVATRAAMHYRALRREGITVRSMADTLIATFCIINRHRLLHNDRDFAPMVRHLGLLEA